MFKKFATKAVMAAGAAALLVGGLAGSASANEQDTKDYYVGYGYANNTHSVWCVQHLLNEVAARKGHGIIAEDGVFGQQTYNDIVWFQQQWNIDPQDGIVGHDTGDALLFTDPNGYGGLYGYCYDFVPSHAHTQLT